MFRDRLSLSFILCKSVRSHCSVARLDRLSILEVKMPSSRLKFLQDWQKVNRSLGQIASSFEHSTFAASSSSDTSVHVRHDEDSLLVRGSTVDKIAKKTNTVGSSDHLSSEYDLIEIAGQSACGLRPLQDFFLSGIVLAHELDGYPTHEGSLDVALRTFLRGPPSEITQKQMNYMQEGVRALFCFMQIGLDLSEKKEEKEADRETMLIRGEEESQMMIGLFTEGGAGVIQRCFCTTEKGYFGLVPAKAEVGDEVGILKGGNVPFILRRSESGNQQELVYRLVGDGYFHGLMHGEAEKLDTYEERDLVII